MSFLKLYLLGPPHVKVDGDPSEINRSKAIALLAYLAITGHSQSRDSPASSALILAGQGNVERAVEMYALAERDPRIPGSVWYEDVIGRHITAAAETLPPKVVEGARARGQSRDLRQTAEELLVELSVDAEADHD